MLFSPRRQLEVVVRFEGHILTRTLLRRGRYIIGQERKNEIVVDQDSISSRHARLTVVSESEILIEDMGSANGTYINGIPAAGSVPITFESKIEIGQCALEFQRSGLPAAIFPHMPPGFLRAQRYQLGNIVVQGRTSTIYEAHDTALNRDIALKMMLPQSQAIASHVLRFIREAQITSQLQHPNIPPIYELSVNEDGHLYYTTRFVEGETLSSILDALKNGDADAQQHYNLNALIGIFQKVCDGVAFAHTHGVVHTALTPENITVGAYGEVFIMGWGFSALLPAPPNLTEAEDRIRVHAPASNAAPAISPFSTPEQVALKNSVQGLDEKVDIYALGGILYKILLLQNPIIAPDDSQIPSRILAGQIPQPAALSRTVRAHWPEGRLPEYLAAVAMKALSLAPDQRSVSVLSLKQKVQAWQEGVTQGADPQKLLKSMGVLAAKH